MGKRRDEKAYNLVRRGNRKRLRHLIGKHSDLRNADEFNLIFCAIWHNRGMLRWLLEHGVSPDCRNGQGGNTPLMQAVAEGDMNTLALLLQFGADPNAENEDGENPLGFAVAWRQAVAIAPLVEAGAGVNDTNGPGPNRTHLDIAEGSSWDEGAEILRSLGGKTYTELAGESMPA